MPGSCNNSYCPLVILFIGIFAGAQTGMADSSDKASVAERSSKITLSYRYNRMQMAGNRDGTDDVTTAEVLRQFPVSPLNMRMEMHMFGLMYQVDDNRTLKLMVPYVEKSMSLVNRRNISFRTRSRGLGDIEITGSYRLCRPEEGNDSLRCRFSLDAGLSLPTGETDKRDDTPAGNIKLPYPMQLGSGTFDPVLGISYSSGLNAWKWGARAKTKLRFGKNDEGYRWGHEHRLGVWAETGLSRAIRASFQFDGRFRGNIHGKDSELNPAMIATARTDLRGGKRIDALFGLSSMLHGHRLSVQFGWPLYQDLDGPQLETDYRFMLGWQKML